MNESYEEAKELYVNSKITLTNVCKKFNFGRFGFSTYLKKNNISLRKKISADDTLFEKIDTEEKAYWLGFLYADGYIRYDIKRSQYAIELGLSINDLNHLEKFKLFMKSDNNITFKREKTICRLIISSKKMCEDLVKLGCYQKKSLTLIFPDNNQVPIKFQKDFIRGYFDGDGCISIGYKSNSPSVSVLGTFEFITEIIKICKLRDGVLKKDKRHLNNTYLIRLRVLEGIEFLHFIYNNSNINLNRKYLKYKFLLSCRSGKKFLELSGIKNGEG